MVIFSAIFMTIFCKAFFMHKWWILFVFVSVGQPIEVTKVESPSQEQIDELHAKYLSALRDLYNEYNPIYGDPKVELNFTWFFMLLASF